MRTTNGAVFPRSSIDCDGVIGARDLTRLLEAWGPCSGDCPPACAGDLDVDCAVGVSDLVLLLDRWGT